MQNAARSLEPHPFSGAEGVLLRIGDTPLLRLDRSVRDLIPSGVQIWAKAEWFNPGGSVKDRAALAMVLDAERSGRLRPGMTILDASSGNTGISYALIAAARGYQLKLCLPANANKERLRTLHALGAEVISTSPLEGSDGAIQHAKRLARSNPELVYLDQYSNPSNWLAHYHSTGPEILKQSHEQITHFVACLGTSGTFMGTSRFLKDHDPNIQVVSVQPDSPFHGLEGLKHMETAIVPKIYNSSVADFEVEAPTEESFELMRKIAAQEGHLIGPSGAAAVWAAISVANTLKSGFIVTILPDSGSRYLSEPHLWESEND